MSTRDLYLLVDEDVIDIACKYSIRKCVMMSGTKRGKGGGSGGGLVQWRLRCLSLRDCWSNRLVPRLIGLGSSLPSQSPWILDLVSIDNSVRLVSFLWVGG